jgi:hypothetical protein
MHLSGIRAGGEPYSASVLTVATPVSEWEFERRVSGVVDEDGGSSGDRRERSLVLTFAIGSGV